MWVYIKEKERKSKGKTGKQRNGKSYVLLCKYLGMLINEILHIFINPPARKNEYTL